ASQLAGDARPPVKLPRHTVLLLVPRMHAGIVKAMDYALSLHGECRAVHITLEPAGTKELKDEWQKNVEQIPLVVLPSPYRSLIRSEEHTSELQSRRELVCRL